jgi:hypothetical protein
MNLKLSCGLFALVFIILSCEKEFSNVGSSLLPSDTFVIDSQMASVEVEHNAVEIIRSDNLSFFYLGEYEDQVFGNTTARFTTQLSLPNASTGIFGKMNVDQETNGVGSENINKNPHDEQETVTQVWLEIPFYTNQRDRDGDGVIDVFDIDPDDPDSDSDGDTLTDLEESRLANLDPLNPDTDGDGINDAEDEDTINPDTEANVYEIDYLYGDTNQEVHFQVKKLNFFLPNLDPEDNFESDKAFYSDKDFEQEGLTSQPLFDDKFTLDFDEIVSFKVDDPETEDVDESTEVDQRLSPRIRIPLDTAFFQQSILEIEGEDMLLDNNRFQEYFNGIVIGLQSTASPLMMQLNFGTGVIKIEYDYKELVLTDGGDASNAEDYESQDSSSVYTLNLSGVRFNTITQTQTSAEVQTAINGSGDGQNIYLKGGLGVVSYIDLFVGDAGQDQLQTLQDNPWLINEANLTLYVDRQKINDLGLNDLPSRLYLFDASESIPLLDFNADPTSGPNPADIKSTFGGLAQVDDNGDVTSYKFVITNHLSNLLRNPDDFDNVRLGLTVSSDFLNTQNTSVTAPTAFEIPQSSINTPLSVILAGPNHSNPDLRLQLEIFYTAYE